MNDYFYSKKNNGFYPLSLKEDYEASPNGWPDDAVSISEEDYNALNAGQSSGKIISTDDNGYPVLIDPPPLSQEQLAINATEERESLLAEATIKIAPLQDAVDIEVATDEEKSRLIAWKKYRVLLNRIDISKAPDITWPEKPD